MKNVLQNLRFSLRMLRKSLGLTATVVITLALGIGATTAIYTVVYATLLAPMPYPDRLNQDLVVPLVVKPEQLNHDFHWLLVMGRLKPGVTLQQAQADMNAVTTHIAQANPRSNKGWGATVEPVGVLLLASVLVACYFPARRAAAIEPMKALRIE